MAPVAAPPVVGAIVQARMGSTRLPGKALADIEGMSMLARVVDRVRRARTVNRVIVATTTKAQDDVLAVHARDLGVDVFRGDEDDVLDRYYQAALQHHLDIVVRITSDCPLLDPGVLDDAVRPLLVSGSCVEYSSTGLQRTFPRGMDVEVVPFLTLAQVWRDAKAAHERAHVFPYIHEHPERFSTYSVMDDVDHSHMRWTVDTPEDLTLVRQVYRELGTRAFTWRDVLTILERRPELLQINEHVRQKTAHDA